MKLWLAVLGFLASWCCTASAQFIVDVDSESVRKAAGEVSLDDLSINDTALIYPDYCVSDNQLYVAGWTEPRNLATATYAASSVILKVTILPGKRLKAVFIDGAQAQSVAKGNPNAPTVLSQREYDKEVLQSIVRIFEGGTFVRTTTCDKMRENNALRTLNQFQIDSINEVRTISELLKSVSKK